MAKTVTTIIMKATARNRLKLLREGLGDILECNNTGPTLHLDLEDVCLALVGSHPNVLRWG